MNKIKLSEIFYSFQLEGKYMGVPSVFIRTFGCNFRCASFNLPEGVPNTEVREIIKKADTYSKLSDLPLVKTGCDSYGSVYPEFKHLCNNYTVEELVAQINILLPFGKFNSEHLVITGGEPLLGWQEFYVDLLEQLPRLEEVTFETNGTQSINVVLSNYLNKKKKKFTFSVSPKLSCSGENTSVSIKPNIIVDYQSYGDTYLKFVVATEDDVLESLVVIETYRNAGFTGPVYLMPVGGTVDSFTLHNRQVADLALKYGLRYSDRLQVSLYKNAWGT